MAGHPDTHLRRMGRGRERGLRALGFRFCGKQLRPRAAEQRTLRICRCASRCNQTSQKALRKQSSRPQLPRRWAELPGPGTLPGPAAARSRGGGRQRQKGIRKERGYERTISTSSCSCCISFAPPPRKTAPFASKGATGDVRPCRQDAAGKVPQECEHPPGAAGIRGLSQFGLTSLRGSVFVPCKLSFVFWFGHGWPGLSSDCCCFMPKPEAQTPAFFHF